MHAHPLYCAMLISSSQQCASLNAEYTVHTAHELGYYYLCQVVLGEFITSQLAHHAKALELYTLAYRHVQHISEDEAVEVLYSVNCNLLFLSIIGHQLLACSIDHVQAFCSIKGQLHITCKAKN